MPTSSLSRRGFLAAAVPVVAAGQLEESSGSPAYAVVLYGKSKRFTDGRPRVAHVTPDKEKAARLAAKLSRHPGRGAYVVTVAGKAVSA